MLNRSPHHSRDAADRRPPYAHIQQRRTRRGIAVKELLLVLAVATGGGVCVMLLDPISDKQRDVRAGEPELLMQCEVAIGDEFVCVATVTSYENPDSSATPFRRSQLMFARQNSGADGAFLFDTHASEDRHWYAHNRCRTWSFTTEESLLNEATSTYSTSEDALTPSERDQFLVEIWATDCWVLQVNRLPDPLRQCVPRPLRESGLLAITGSTCIEHVHELSGYPLARLAAAIRKATHEEDWTREDPQLLLPAGTAFDLSPDQQQNLARALIRRLEGALPAGRQFSESPTKAIHLSPRESELPSTF
jgi:hypothetical protein